MKPPFDFILQVLRAAWRRRYLICAPLLIMPLLGWFIGQLTTTAYEASTSILIQESGKHNPFMKDISIDTNIKKRMPGLSTLLHSRHVLEKVLVQIGQINEDTPDYERDQAVRKVSGALSVKLVGQDLVAFSYRHTNPKGMAKVLRAVRDQFIDRLLSPERSTIEGSQRFLKRQLAQRTAELERAEKEFRQFQANHNAELPELQSVNLQRLSVLQQKLEDKRIELSSTGAALKVRQQRLARSNPLIGRLEEAMVTAQGELSLLMSRYTEKHSKVRKLRKRLERLRRERQGLMDAAGKLSSADLQRLWNIALGHRPSGDKSEGSLLVSQMERVQEANAQTATLNQEVRLLETAIETVRSRITKTSEVNHRKQSLEHAIKLARKNYEEIAERYESARVVGALGRFEAPERVKIIEPAVDPTVPVTPGLIVFILGGFVGGIALGCSLTVLAELMDSRLATQRSFEELVGAPVLVRLPRVITGTGADLGSTGKLLPNAVAEAIGRFCASRLRMLLELTSKSKKRPLKGQAA